MKIVVFSMSRSFTKNTQNLLALTLSPDQLKIVSPNNQVLNHLGELLNFSECTSKGYDPEVKDWRPITLENSKRLKYYVPHYDPEIHSFVLRECKRYSAVPFAEVQRVLSELAAAPGDWVLKFFPNTLRTQLTEVECEYVIERVLGLADVVVPLMRLDLSSRVNSVSKSARFGWTNYSPTVEQMEAPGASDAEYAQALQAEIAFRRTCVHHGLRPVWAEALPKNHTRILKGFGIDTTGLHFSGATEYSGGKK